MLLLKCWSQLPHILVVEQKYCQLVQTELFVDWHCCALWELVFLCATDISVKKKKKDLVSEEIERVKFNLIFGLNKICYSRRNK